MRLLVRVLLFPVWLVLGYMLSLSVLSQRVPCRILGWGYETGTCGFYTSLFTAPAVAFVLAVIMTLLIGRKRKPSDDLSGGSDPRTDG